MEAEGRRCRTPRALRLGLGPPPPLCSPALRANVSSQAKWLGPQWHSAKEADADGKHAPAALILGTQLLQPNHPSPQGNCQHSFSIACSSSHVSARLLPPLQKLLILSSSATATARILLQLEQQSCRKCSKGVIICREVLALLDSGTAACRHIRCKTCFFCSSTIPRILLPPLDETLTVSGHWASQRWSILCRASPPALHHRKLGAAQDQNS